MLPPPRIALVGLLLRLRREAELLLDGDGFLGCRCPPPRCGATNCSGCDHGAPCKPRGMSEPKNRQWRLAVRPSGMIEDRNFRWAVEPIPEIADGEILVRNLYLSLDPTQRGWLSRDTYLPAVKIDEVVRSFAVGRVEKSRAPGFAVGDLVQGLFGWRDFARVPATGAAAPTKLVPGVPIPLAMSALGVTGITAYFGLLDVG